MTLVLFENTFLVDADNYLYFQEDWLQADDSTKDRCLAQATEILNEQTFFGMTVQSDQPLNWPRSNFVYLDKEANRYITVPSGEVPRRLEKATALLALHILRNPEIVEQSSTAVSFDRIKLGPLEFENTDASSNTGRVPRLPAAVRKLIAPLLNQPNGSSNTWWRAN